MSEPLPLSADTLDDFERALVELGKARYDLTLFVSGASPLSARAIADVTALCETHLPDRYRLRVVDVRQNPQMVTERGILAAPTLVKDFPLPKRLIVGSLSDSERVLLALDIVPLPAGAATRSP